MPPHPAAPVSVPILETPRLLLRDHGQADFGTYAAMVADPEVMHYLGEGKPMSRFEAWRQMAAVIGHWQLRSYGLWAVEERATGKYVGRIGCWYPEDWPRFEIGWTLCREHWGRGFATEAAAASMWYAFEHLGKPHVWSLIRPGNLNSIRVAERLGETLEDRVQVIGGESLIYGIAREKWTPPKEPPRIRT
jgi:RimJ/RimL family protein N-acetyltransferase